MRVPVLVVLPRLDLSDDGDTLGRRSRLVPLAAEAAVIDELEHEAGLAGAGRADDQGTGARALDDGAELLQQPVSAREQGVALQQGHLEEQGLQGQLGVLLHETDCGEAMQFG